MGGGASKHVANISSRTSVVELQRKKSAHGKACMDIVSILGAQGAGKSTGMLQKDLLAQMRQAKTKQTKMRHDKAGQDKKRAYNTRQCWTRLN